MKLSRLFVLLVIFGFLLLSCNRQPPPSTQQYTLAVSKGGTGSGTVTGPGIDCGSDCANAFDENTQVSLTATPASGSTFTGWGGACTGTGSCTLMMDSDKLVTATFNLASGGQGQVNSIAQVNYVETGAEYGASCSEPENFFTIPAIDPASVVYYHDSVLGHTLLLTDSEIDELPIYNCITANIFQVSLSGDTVYKTWDTTIVGPNHEPRNREPTGITYCPTDKHFYISNDDGDRLIYRYSFDDGKFTAIDWVSTLAWVDDPEGISCDPQTGFIYTVSGIDMKIAVFSYSNSLGFNLEAVLDLFETAGTPSGVPSDPEGIVVDPVSGNLFVISGSDRAIYEFTTAGVFIKKFDVSGFNPRPSKAAGLGIGPSSTNPNQMSFYFTDRLVDPDSDANARDGALYEAAIRRTN